MATGAGDYGVKWPKAVAKICDDAEALLCFYDFPAERWLYLKTKGMPVQRPDEDQAAGVAA